VHLVAHSKGGLDTREWLATFYRDYSEHRTKTPYFKVLSLTTLSTPHMGSAGADLLVAAEHAISTLGIGWSEWLLATSMGTDRGTKHLTTKHVRQRFNPSNLTALPDDIVYRAIGADADVDGDGRMFCSWSGCGFLGYPEEAPEWGAMVKESSALQNLSYLKDIALCAATFTDVCGIAGIMDEFYQFLKRVDRVKLNEATIEVFGWEIGTFYVGEALGSGGPNDLLVTTKSAAGPLGGPFVTLPSLKRNHADVANEGMAEVILPYLQTTEAGIGDFQPGGSIVVR
jgi:hypothetical protein